MICNSCGEDKLPHLFAKDSGLKSGYSGRCKACDKVRRDCPLAKIKKNKRIYKRRLELKIKSIEYLGGVCKMCGGKFHTASFDFHHKNPETKSFTIAEKNSASWGARVNELDKCVLLCSNCHREFHYKYVGEDMINYNWEK